MPIMLSNADILRHVDHTLLSAGASWAEIKKLCEEAVAFETASVCVPPSYIRRIHDTFGERPVICTVIGFPLGYDTAKVKCAAVRAAIADGAREVDMVVNIGDVKNGDFDAVTAEIAALKAEAGEHILKVIVEACLLTQEEKIALCHCVTQGGADYIKTSTGFSTGGATLEDVLLFKAHIGPNVSIKASGGIRTREDMVRYIEAGCARLGTSSAIRLLQCRE